MGAKWVFLWEPTDGTIVDNHIFDKICLYVESIVGRFERGVWASSFRHWEPIRHDESQAALYPSHLFAITLCEQRNKHYFLQPIEHRIHEMHAWEALQIQITTDKVSLLLSFVGTQYQLANGKILVAKVIGNLTGALGAVFIEMDYFSNFSIEITRNAMESDFETFNQAATDGSWPGRFLQIDRRYGEFGLLGDYYTPKHTMLQYYEVMIDSFSLP